ncbi:MAG: YraN family protein [Dialister sp.]|nr:YraN family protein [Dialister sp.]
MGTTALGRRGEDIACRYLEERGMSLVKKNYKRVHGEVDLIMDDGETLVFVEVKTRQNYRYGRPVEAVTYWKQKHIRYCADMYVWENKIIDRHIRFDVVEVMLGSGEPKINHIRHAF